MQVFLLVMSMVPQIIAAVQAIEAAVPIPSAGKTKLDMVLQILGVAYSVEQAATGSKVNWAQLIPAVTEIIGAVVVGFNTLGIFKKAAVSA